MINAPSLANCGLFTMAEEMDGMIRGGVNFVHIDIMDGHYVPNIFFLYQLYRQLGNVTQT